MNKNKKIVTTLLSLILLVGCGSKANENNNNANQTTSTSTLRFNEKYIESSVIDGSVSVKYDYSIDPYYLFKEDYTGIYQVKYEYDYIYEREVITNFKWTYADASKSSIAISFTSEDKVSKRDGKEEATQGDSYIIEISEDVLSSSLGFIYFSETFAKKLGY